MVVSTSVVVKSFIESYLERKGFDAARFMDRYHEEDEQQQPSREELNEICTSLNKIATQLQKFIGNAHNDRFEKLTEPLIPILREEDEEEFYASFRQIADELFLNGISWSHIVTFLVYNADLACKAIESTLQNDERGEEEDKSRQMVSLVVDSVCRYFHESLMQWINKEKSGWLSLKDLEATAEATAKTTAPSTYRNLKQYVGGVTGAAIGAVVIVGLYQLCSKLSAQ